MLFSLLDIFSNFFYFILNISGGSSFPRPLTAEEETAAWEAYRQKGDKSARNQLIEHNLRLVSHIIKKYYSANTEQDDLVSIGTIGLMKAVDTFDASKGTRLSSYAARCIENEILMYFRNNRKIAQNISINEPIDTDKEGNSLTLMDIISVDDTIADDIDLKMKSEQLKRFIKNELEPRERQIIVLRYGLGNTDPLPQRTIAQKLKISRSYVSRIEKRALEKLKKAFEQD